jgi:Uma2 family endonuclease
MGAEPAAGFTRISMRKGVAMLVQAKPVQHKPMTVAQFLKRPEEIVRTYRHEELVFGWIVREPAASALWHELDIGNLRELLKAHVRTRQLGFAFGSVGVVLDEVKKLVLIPDLAIVLGERVRFVDNQIWGPPNIVIEVASPSTQRRDRNEKLGWYRTYGVEECWLADARKGFIEVHRLRLPPEEAGRVFRGDEIVETDVLPEFRFPASQLLAQEERADIARFSYDKPGS